MSMMIMTPTLLSAVACGAGLQRQPAVGHQLCILCVLTGNLNSSVMTPCFCLPLLVVQGYNGSQLWDTSFASAPSLCQDGNMMLLSAVTCLSSRCCYLAQVHNTLLLSAVTCPAGLQRQPAVGHKLCGAGHAGHGAG
jgi:hypothetical protein